MEEELISLQLTQLWVICPYLKPTELDCLLSFFTELTE